MKRFFWLAPLIVALLALTSDTAKGNGYGPTFSSAALIAQNTTHTVVSGQSYAALPTDIVRMDTSNSADAGGLTVILPGNPGNQQILTTCWVGWAASQVPPVVNASAVDGGALMQPFSGQSASLTFTTRTAVTTPGACPSWKYDGSEWVVQ